MNEEKKVVELIGQEGELNIAQAIRIAKIVASAPEERLPMIIDIFEQAGLDISGMEDIENLKELAKSREQITGLCELLQKVTGLTSPINGEYRIPAEAFDGVCQEFGQNIRIVRRTLAEMGIIRINIVNGRNGYSIPVYNPETKKIMRCICIKEDWIKIMGE